MRHVIQLTVTISVLTVSQLLAQAVQRDAFIVPRTEVADSTSRKLIGVTPTTDITAQAAEGSSMLESVVTGAVAGGAMGFLGGFLVGGVMNMGITSIGSETAHSCSNKNCAHIGAAIGAAAGLALGAVFGAVAAKPRPSNDRANLRAVLLPNGRSGVQLSVRF